MEILRKGEFKRETTLRRRLFVLILLITLSVIMTFWLLLMAFGITGSDAGSLHSLMESEITHLSEEFGENLGTLSLKGVQMSEDISAKANEAEQPEKMLSEQMTILLNTMNNNNCSGVFFVLKSADGIFLKRTQTVAVQPVNSKILCLRGPAKLARENSVELLGQWKGKFDEQDMSIFESTISTAQNNTGLPLSRLYHWSNRVTLTDNSESGFLLCVPVKGKNNSIIGVCGIEISDRIFKYQYSPDSVKFNDIFSVVAPFDGDKLYADKGMVTGNYFLTSSKFGSALSISTLNKNYLKYANSDGSYGGLQRELNIYPADSPHKSEKWAFTIMLPENTLMHAIRGKSLYLFVIVFLLLLASVAASVIVSRQYIKPLKTAIGRIKEKRYAADDTFTYAEINDLMEFLANREKDKSIAIAEQTANLSDMFDAFVKNIKTLSPAEKNVFDMYIKGYKAQEIADELHLSINTIKTHNRRIFAKLNVSTRKELLVYIDMMREMNMISEVD